ncbi:MAG: hypothetical protein NT027_15845, partial [Proteobacteria bacterium]|nr:hypothetical protein [Pseudomonadota bacterium]
MKMIFMKDGVKAFLFVTAMVGSSQLFGADYEVEGRFKLYSKAHQVPSAGCDEYLQLDLVKNPEIGTNGMVANLGKRLSGVCRLHVNPDERSYDLISKRTSCGEVIYSGVKSNRLGQTDSIEIVDSRNSICDNIVLANVVVRETRSDVVKHFYSYDKALSSESKPTKFSCDGVAGVDEWVIYLDLEKKLAGFFDNDNTTVIPLVDTLILESNPPQGVYTFNGQDTGGGEFETLKITFNDFTLASSITFNPNTKDELTHVV